MAMVAKWNPTWIKLETILDRRTWVYYLIIPDLIARRVSDRFKVQPDQRFYDVLNEHVSAYVEQGKMPPKAIMPAVMNIADDILEGRDVVIRAGDYIAVQDYVRTLK
jgi:hypothetical protein